MMKVHTLLGEVSVTDAYIKLASGHGNYTIVATVEFEGEQKALNIHSTDSELYDAAKDSSDSSALILERAESIIEDAVTDYTNSL